MRRSLLVRLALLTLSVTVVSVGATAWLASLVLNRGIEQANGQSRAETAVVYRTLLHYGATHRGWTGVGPLVASLGHRVHEQVALVDLADRRLALARSGDKVLPLGSPSAIVDALHVDPSLDPGVPASGIDPAAVGPFALTADDRAQLDELASLVLTCVRRRTGGARAIVGPLGRPEIVAASPAVVADCGGAKLGIVVLPDERPALDELGLATDVCLKSRHLDGVTLVGNLTWNPGRPESAAVYDATRSCVDGALRDQLTAWVAPPALLYLTSPAGGRGVPVFSTRNELRIAEVVAAVVALAAGATVLAGSRLVRPLRALTAAARGVEAHGFTEVVEVSGSDEIAHLTRAFNQMARAQAQMEEQRKVAIGDIAHELRTPLANIRAWLEAARDGLADPDEALAGSLLEEAMLLQRTVDDLQLLSLADAGQLALHRSEVAIAPLLAQARAALSGPAELAGVDLRLACPDVAAVVDPDRVRQIVQNLVANAIRHSHPGGSVEVVASSDHGGVRVDVVDHGSGIAAEDLPYVFERFWRAEKSRTRSAGGSGLGLAIVRQLAEAHGGTVTVRSTPGEATVFSVLLPAPAPASAGSSS